VRGAVLALAALGLIAMHTLGHVTGAHRHPFATVGASIVRTFPIASSATHSLHLPMFDELDVAATRLGSLFSGGGLDPATVCLAVLTVAIAAVMLAVAMRLRRRSLESPPSHRGHRPAKSRDPPRWVPVGLLIADLSVLRT
jgi:hypothetical protein